MRRETITWRLRVPGEPMPDLAQAVAEAVERSLHIRFDRVEEPGRIDWDPTGIAAEWFQDRLRLGGNTPMRASSAEGVRLVWRNRRKGFNPGRVAMSECVIDAPLSASLVERAAPGLAAIGGALGAYVGEVSTSLESRALLGIVGRRSGRSPSSPPFGLPTLKGVRDLASPLHPARPAWINYWSAETCRLLGFPDRARDAALLARGRPLPNGAWLVRLSDEPLDPASRPAHVRALADACARFPAIGGRDPFAGPVLVSARASSGDAPVRRTEGVESDLDRAPLPASAARSARA
jgi:Family of unknown function (DUF5953)